MTANKSSKAAPRAGGGKAGRDAPDRSVTCGTLPPPPPLRSQHVFDSRVLAEEKCVLLLCNLVSK